MESGIEKLTNNSSSLFLLTNTWTHAKHGHARGELDQVSKFLESKQLESRIVGNSRSFGDYPKFSLGEFAHRMKSDHSRLFKNWVDERLIYDLESNISRVSKELKANLTKAVFTSIKYSHISRFSRLWDLDCNFSFRFIDLPADKGLYEKSFRLGKKAKSNYTFAIENKRSLEAVCKFWPSIIHVPPAQSLRTESNDLNQARRRIGIFFPVGKPSNTEFVLELINTTRHLNPIIKLPANMMSSAIIERYNDCDFVSPGLTNEEFNKILSSIKVAILGHQNYIHYSSAYASYFISNNVPVVVSKNNLFEEEFGKQLVFSLPTKNQGELADIVRELYSHPIKEEKSEYAEYASNQWLKFIDQSARDKNSDS